MKYTCDGIEYDSWNEYAIEHRRKCAIDTYCGPHFCGPFFNGFFEIGGQDESDAAWFFMFHRKAPHKISGHLFGQNFDELVTIYPILEFTLGDKIHVRADANYRVKDEEIIEVPEGEFPEWDFHGEVTEYEEMKNTFGDQRIFEFTISELKG